MIGDLPVHQIQTEHILKVLEPIWMEKNETALRLRGRIEVTLDWATVAGHREGENPARWKGNLQHLFAAPGRVQSVKGHPAIALDDLSSSYGN